MLFGINESNTMVAVEEMHVPAHLAESFEGIVALGNNQAEKLYEEVINAQGEFAVKLQRGISSGRLQEACEEIIQEGAFSNFISKVKEMFKKLWAAIKALFAKFIAWIDTKIKSDKDFIAKYKQILSKKSSEVSDMEYKGHNWGTFDVGKESENLKKTAEETKKEGEKAAEKVEEATKDAGDKDKAPEQSAKPANEADESPSKDGSDREALIAAAIKEMARGAGVKESDEPADVASDYREKLYGGSVEAESMTGPDVSKLINVVETYEKDKAAANKIFQATDKGYNSTIRALEKAERAALKSTEVDFSSSTALAVAKAKASLHNQLVGIYLAALKDRRDEARSVLAKVITYKKK